MHYLTTGIGRPFLREETSVDSRGNSRTDTIYADQSYVSFGWSHRPNNNGRYYSYGHVVSLTETSNLKLEGGIYSFTVTYTEYETRLGKRGESVNYSSIPNNGRVYIENFVSGVYESVMKKHFPNMRSMDSFFETISENRVHPSQLPPQTLNEVFGEGVSKDNFIRAQEEICTRLKEFYNKDSHKAKKFSIGSTKVPKWETNSNHSAFYFAVKKSEEFNVSFRAKFASALLVSPVVSQSTFRIDSYERNGNYVRTSRVGDLQIQNVDFKVSLPEPVENPVNRYGEPHNGYGWNERTSDSNTAEYNLTVLAITMSGTKSRPKRGAWQGPYTGISKLKSKVSNRTYLEYVSEYGMPNCAPSLTNFKALVPQRTTFLDIEGRDQILTPIVDISPIELGHVNLYRLGNSMYDLQGTRLNDYLVPSMKNFILSLSAEKVLTIEPEDQVECVGNDVTCKKIEQVTLLPGSYLVKVKNFCNKHHDANRPEYNNGMGKFVNLEITTRNVLRVIKVHDGQIREDTVEFVGAEAIATTFNDFDTFDERW